MEWPKNLTQDPLFIKHGFTEPEEISALYKTKFLKPLHHSLISTSAAFCDFNVGNDHLLDGYSYGLITYISGNEIRIYCKKIQEDENDRLNELKSTSSYKFGLFTGKLSTCKKIFGLGRLPQLLSTGRAVERTTAHQPIFFPLKSQIYFCSAYTYPAFNITKEEDQSNLKIKREESFVQEYFEKDNYTCMHPLYDYENKELLTYTFLHSKFSKKTSITFHSFSSKDPNPIKYEVNDRLALHMFGFTKNYYIIFGNSLLLKNGGYFQMIFGTPILRTINDDYCGDLIIHFIARNGSHSFSVNTKQKGFVYHTINCFEENNLIIIDALVSKLNESRESSQFELNTQRDVYDNEGDPFRFVIDTESKNIRNKLLTVQIDTSIDFHCINPLLSGKKYSKWWMVSHRRERDDKGNFIRNISKLHQVSVNYKNDPLNYDPEQTLRGVHESNKWSDNSVYLRTPVFVPYKDQDSECDGLLFCWSYDDIDLNYLSSKLLIFSSGLILLQKIEINAMIPYSIHSFPHIFENDEEL